MNRQEVKEASPRPRREQKVWDDRGGEYVLETRLSRGGQGTIVRIRGHARLIVKLANAPADAPRTIAWKRQLDRVRHLPVQDMGLPVVMPLAMIEKPRPGYLMELIEGLVPLEALMREFDEAMHAGRELQGFVESGGLGRRLAILARLARVLASLHGLGIAHGDLSPNNVFASSTHAHAQVWLIDADNLTYAVRDSSLQIFTPDYGAPELVRGDAGISTYTDIWSFAVMAFQLLTHLHPLKSGWAVDGDADLEAPALRGEYPWIDHPDDDSNRAESGIDRAMVCTPALARLFDQCFRCGLNEPAARPVMSEWAEAFEAAHALLVHCDHGPKCCGGAFLWNPERRCPFCDSKAPAGHAVLLSHHVLAAKADLPEHAATTDRWIESGWRQVINVGTTELRQAPPGSAAYAESDALATVGLAGSVLSVTPTRRIRLGLRLKGTRSAPALSGRTDLQRKGTTYNLHVGDLKSTHDVWHFEW